MRLAPKSYKTTRGPSSPWSFRWREGRLFTTRGPAPERLCRNHHSRGEAAGFQRFRMRVFYVMGNRRWNNVEYIHMLGMPESERLEVTALNFFHPTASPLSRRAGFPYCDTASEGGELPVSSAPETRPVLFVESASLPTSLPARSRFGEGRSGRRRGLPYVKSKKIIRAPERRSRRGIDTRY